MLFKVKGRHTVSRVLGSACERFGIGEKDVPRYEVHSFSRSGWNWRCFLPPPPPQGSPRISHRAREHKGSRVSPPMSEFEHPGWRRGLPRGSLLHDYWDSMNGWILVAPRVLLLVVFLSPWIVYVWCESFDAMYAIEMTGGRWLYLHLTVILSLIGNSSQPDAMLVWYDLSSAVQST